jgi:hypothetical protein
MILPEVFDWVTDVSVSMYGIAVVIVMLDGEKRSAVERAPEERKCNCRLSPRRGISHSSSHFVSSTLPCPLYSLGSRKMDLIKSETDTVNNVRVKMLLVDDIGLSDAS